MAALRSIIDWCWWAGQRVVSNVGSLFGRAARPAAAATRGMSTGAAAAASADAGNHVHATMSGQAPTTMAVPRPAAGSALPDDPAFARRPRPAGIPADATPYRRTPMFTASTVPKGLLRDHTTRPEVWGLIHVQEGELAYHVTDPRREPSRTVLSASTSAGLIEPTILHHVEPLGDDVKFYVEFNRVEAPATAAAQ